LREHDKVVCGGADGYLSNPGQCFKWCIHEDGESTTLLQWLHLDKLCLVLGEEGGGRRLFLKSEEREYFSTKESIFVQ